MAPDAEPSFSYFEWFFRALGYWYSFTLLIGFSVFVWSCCEFFLKTRIRFRGFHGVLVLLPILVSMLGRSIPA
jgi:hypothetical protein